MSFSDTDNRPTHCMECGHILEDDERFQGFCYMPDCTAAWETYADYCAANGIRA